MGQLNRPYRASFHFASTGHINFALEVFEARKIACDRAFAHVWLERSIGHQRVGALLSCYLLILGPFNQVILIPSLKQRGNHEMTMASAPTDQQRVQCQNLLRLIREAEREIEALKNELAGVVSRIEELEGSLEQLEPTQLVNRPSIESEIGKARAKKNEIEGLVREKEARLAELNNDFNLQGCGAIISSDG